MKFKFVLITVLTIVLMQFASAQIERNGSFDTSLQQLTDQLAEKLVKYNGLKMGVWDLSDLNGGVSPIGRYIADDVAINLADKFHIVNRNQLNTLIKENQLSAEGFINQATLKQVKKLSDIEVVITGYVSILSQNIKITLEALDSDGNILAGVKGEVQRNADVNELLGINTGTSNRGFNRSLNSNEQVNNPQTVNKDCETKNLGDYCFLNQSKYVLKVSVEIYPIPYSRPYNTDVMVLNPGESKCIYNYKAGNVYRFRAQLNDPKDYNNGQRAGYYYSSNEYLLDIVDEGTIRIEKCQSKTYTITSNSVRNP